MKLQDLYEGRVKGITYTLKTVKEKIERVTAELKGKESATWTRIAKQYKELSDEIDSLKKKKDKLNVEIKDKATEIFDVEDQVLTRVVETTNLTITLSKKTRVEAHNEVDYEAVVKALAEADLPGNLRKIINKIVESNTKLVAASETPERLTVKYTESVMEGIVDLLKTVVSKIKEALAVFDRKFSAIKKKVDAL
jgi:chromosome segregation ATPase